MPITGSKQGKSSKNAASGSRSDGSGKKRTSPDRKSTNKYQKCDNEIYRRGDGGNWKGKKNNKEGELPKITDDKGVRRDTSNKKAENIPSSSSQIPGSERAPIRDIMKKLANERAPKQKNATSGNRDEVRAKAAEAAQSRSDFSKIGFVKEKSTGTTTNQMAVQSILYGCPVVSDELLKSTQWRPKIISYLSELSRTEPAMSAVLTVHTLNSNKDKIDECIQLLNTYLKNVIMNPDEDKYRAIKTTNRTFAEKVLPIKGAVDFLKAAGFKTETRTDDAGTKIEYLYLPGKAEVESLEMLTDALRSAEPLLPTVYRDPTILKPQEADEKIYLPDDFYDLTDKELTEMYKKNMTKLEEESPLMTKAMRDKEERKYLAKYKYSLLRVRFPDAVCLQGTFSRYDTQGSIKEFVDSCLVRPLKYSLFCPVTKNSLVSSNDDKTLYDLKLIPSVVLNYVPDEKEKFPKAYLKADVGRKIKTN